MTDTTKPWAEKGLSVDDRAHTIFMQIAPTHLMIKETLDAAVAQALADNAPGWINVKERLPESRKLVVIWIHDVVSVGRYCPAEERWRDRQSALLITYPTHWQPLPAPPQEEDTP